VGKGDEQLKKKWLAVLMVLSLMMSVYGVVTYAAEENVNWDVSVGKATEDGISLDSMFPKVVFVHEGDTVTFKNGSLFTPHTVTFLAGSAPLSPQDPANFAPSAASGLKWDGKALLNSGIMEPGNSYSVTFTASGAYPYYCILHPLMTGTVVVIPKGQPIPSKVEQIAAANTQTDDLIEQAKSLTSAKHEAHVMNNTDGTFSYHMEMGVGHRGFSVNKMLPETLFISEGDSVEWLNDNHYEPHFITFNKPSDLSFFLPGGAFNPAFMAPAGGAQFDGTGFTNSGMIQAMQSYKLTFTQAGTFTYECYLHTGDKMTGTIVVAPKDSIKVSVNNKPLIYDYKLPHLHNNHVYVGLVAFAEALGGTAIWDETMQAVIMNIGGKFTTPSSLTDAAGVKVVMNGKQLLYGFDPAPHLHDGRSFAPVQELISLLGGSYSWDESTKTLDVFLNVQGSAPAPLMEHKH
jgi:plastocyanin